MENESKIPQLKKELTDLYQKVEIPPDGITYVEKLLEKKDATEKELSTAIEHCRKYPAKKALTPEVETEFNEPFGKNSFCCY